MEGVDRASENQVSDDAGWKRKSAHPSLPEVFQSILVPGNAGSWRKFLAFAGPGYLIAVGYMDPGNWATDIAGGSAYNYSLLSVVLMANFLAVFLQALSAKLGIVTGRDLAQACHNTYHPALNYVLWISAEIGIIACDIAEVVGAGIALNLLFHIPLIVGCALTGFDVLLVLALQGKGFRYVEAMVMGLIGTMVVLFIFELLYSKPELRAVLDGFIPDPKILRNPDMLYISLGILGATVMPHNLYLHSSIVQTRRIDRTDHREVASSIRAAYTDSTVALTIALFVNAAILILAASVFYRSGHKTVQTIEEAYRLITPIVGVSLAAPLFAIALLASGQNSTLTGTMAGQVIMEGFTTFQLAPWKRRLVSRLLAIVPTLLVVYFFGSKGVGPLMILSQVILSAQLSFAVFPLVQITGDRRKMGRFVNGWGTKCIGWTAAVVVLVLNTYLIYVQLIGRGA